MPYPPPPGPPTVGFFQGIGRLIAPTLPDVTGHATEFLETDGVIPQWEPITGVLPDQTGHAGEFLTTDGATPSWTAFSPGGITTVGALTTPTANAAVITGGNTLQLAPADASNPGVVSTGVQSFDGLKTFEEEPITSPYDVRRFGAVPNDPTNDLATAFYACLASQTNNPAGLPMFFITADYPTEVYIPQGIWFTSMPLCGAGIRTGEGTIRGAGPALTTILPGTGSASTPSNVQSFSGPVIYTMPCFTAAQILAGSVNLPVYGPPLVGVTGQSYVLSDVFDTPQKTLRLHDSFPWGSWLGDYVYRVTDFSLQFWVTVDGPLTGWIGTEKGIIGSRGPGVWQTRIPNPTADIAFGVYAVSNGSTLKLRAYLTTNPNWDSFVNMQSTGTLYSIDSSNITPGTTHHVEIDYDGSHFDFYLDGVNQGHVVATGPIIRCPWEGVAIGSQGPELLEAPQDVVTIEGAIDSVRLSNVHRHTGVGSFTPPASKYTWDANTMALYNWDQPMKTATYGLQTITLPFVVGQVVTNVDGLPGGAVAGPLPHYIRLTGPAPSPDMHYQDFSINALRSGSGLVAAYSYRGDYSNIWIQGCSQFGLAVLTGVSFYTNISDIFTFDVVGTGIQYMGDCFRSDSQQCGIAVGIYTGTFNGGNYQPTFTSYAGLVVYDGSFPTEVSYFSLDDEVWPFNRQIGGGVVLGNPLNVYFHHNYWGSSGGFASSFSYLKIFPHSKITHQHDTFAPDARVAGLACSALTWKGGGIPSGRVLLENCYINDPRVPPLPISNIDGWVSVRNAAQSSNQSGLSIADDQANNLAGEFSVNGDFDYGGPRFVVPEKDGNYEVLITPLTSLGGAPAAGSNRVLSVTTTAHGFTAFFEAAPGGIVENIYSYMIVRRPPPAEYFSYLPTIPSSITNPLNTTDANVPFAIGVTFGPVTGKCIAWQTVGAQTIAEAGTTVETGNWWELGFEGSQQMFRISIGAFAVDLDSQVIDGSYFNIFNPGVHNVVLAYPGTAGAPSVYLDGYGPDAIAGVAATVGVQQTPIYIGERYDTSHPLTTLTLKNLKISRVASRCVSDDSGIGPGLKPQSAFFGDTQVFGTGATSTSGGFATQLAEIRYPSAYYWIGGRVTGALFLTPAGTYKTIFQPWLGMLTAPTLVNFCLWPGIADIYNGQTATDIFAVLVKMLEGEKASATWNPPNSYTYPADLRAWAIHRVPASGSETMTINGQSFTLPFNTNSNTTVNDAIAQMAADPPTDALFLGQNVVDPNTGLNVLRVQARVGGSLGNSYIMASDGGGGAFWYGDIGGQIPGTALSVGMLGGRDTTVEVAGVTFIGNFDTDADTTVNNVIALIAANPTVDALVQCTLASGQMLVEAKTAGAAGNLITAGGNGYDTVGPNWDNNTGHLIGGSNGMIPSGVGNIIFCTCPPIGGGFGVTPSMITELNSLNVLINAYVGTGVTIADVWTLLHDPGSPDDMLPAYGTGTTIQDDGQTAVFNFLAPLLPGAGTPPSALSYATNPASYASGGPIATNSPTVTGSVTLWTVNPPLPAGLSIDAGTGDIDGTPTTPTAAADYTVVAHNAAGSVAVTLNITIT